MRASIPRPGQSASSSRLRDLLTFDRLMIGPVVHIIYWCGLGLVCLSGFAVIGAAVGVAIRDGSLQGALLGIPVLVGGLLGMAILALLWRGACEFFMAVFRIADDLSALRVVAEKLTNAAQQPPPPKF
jgi:hypothetical protein